MTKIQFTATLQNRVGLHARPAALFVRTAKKFSSEITVIKEGVKDGNKADAKRILGVLGLGVEKGDTITVYLEGEDAVEAKEKLLSLIENKFGED